MCLGFCKRVIEALGCVFRLLYCVLCLLASLFVVLIIVVLVWYFCFYDKDAKKSNTTSEPHKRLSVPIKYFVEPKNNYEEFAKGDETQGEDDAPENNRDFQTEPGRVTPKVTPIPEKLLNKLLQTGMKEIAKIFQAS